LKDKRNFVYKIDNLSFSYSLGKEKFEAISGISLKIPGQTLVTFSGPSGSGKSTLLNVLGLIEPVQKGTVIFRDEDLKSMSEKKKNHIRKYHIGYIFQQFHLIPVLTAEENVKYFLAKQELSQEEIEERAEEALRSVGLWEHRKKKPAQLSGGQKQRVAVARALAKKPDVIIGDEPTASLDRKTGEEIIELLFKMAETRNTSIILATHDQMVMSYATKNFHIQDGHLCG